MITRLSIVTRRKCLSPSALRCLSTHESPSPKIRAIPFAHIPETAIERSHVFALLMTGRPANMAMAVLRSVLGPRIGYWIQQQLDLGLEVKMKEAKAAYYPIWRVDAMLEGHVKGKDKKEQKGWMGVTGAHIPGNSFAPLSFISFTSPIPDDLPIYEPETQLQQLGEGFEVVPVPFTVSPLGLVEHAKKVVGNRPTIQNVTFDMSTWTSTLLACYPIMLPIYISEFEYAGNDGETKTLNIVMEAHEEKLKSCALYTSPLMGIPASQDRRFPKARSFVPDHQDDFPVSLPEPIEDEDETPKFIKIVRVQSVGDQLVDAFDEWMGSRASGGRTLTASPMSAVENEEGGVDWSDERIRPWATEEREAVEQYYMAAGNVQEAEGKLRALEDIKGVMGRADRSQSSAVEKEEHEAQGSVGLNLESIEEMLSAARGTLEDAKESLRSLKPAWLEAWEKSQRENREGK